MGSNFWLWELNESWPVKPIAEMIKNEKASNVKIYGSYGRPSLNWYSSQEVKVAQGAILKGWILINKTEGAEIEENNINCKETNVHNEWILLYCK